MCWKLVDDNSGEIICRSTIRLAIEPGTANLQVDPIGPIPYPIADPIENTNTSTILDDFMQLANFETSLSPSSPIDTIPESTKSKLWQDVERGIIPGEHHEDLQLRHFHSSQPTVKARQHQYPTRSKSTRSVNTVETTNHGEPVQNDNTADDGEPTKFIYIRDKGEKPIPVWKQYEFILRDEPGKPRLDDEGKPIVVIGMSPEDLVQRVFLNKPDERGDIKRARIIELINKFDDDLEADPTRCKFKIAFENDDSGF